MNKIIMITLVLSVGILTSCCSYQMDNTYFYSTKPGIPQGIPGYYLKFDFEAQHSFEAQEIQVNGNTYNQFYVQHLARNNSRLNNKAFEKGTYSIEVKLESTDKAIKMGDPLVFKIVTSNGKEKLLNATVVKVYERQLR